MPLIETYDEVRAWADEVPKTHLLLGNGFSIAWRPETFNYGSLFDRADFGTASPEARQAFDALGTRDFEAVMERLRAAASLTRIYGAGAGVPDAMERDAAALRELLAATIAAAHPGGPFEVTDDQFAHCRAFLAAFDNVYTANYDLLLYWALLHDEAGDATIRADDGFRQPDTGPEDYVVWEADRNYTQTIYYLHGALHLFDAGHELRKFTWRNTGIRLIDQIRSALDNGLFPLIVTEGTTDEKLARIYHSAYLSKCLKSFSNITGGLVTFGVSFTENDQHLVKAIVRSRVTRLGVGVFGDADSPQNRHLVSAVEGIAALAEATRGPATRAVEMRYFEASSAPLWGPCA